MKTSRLRSLFGILLATGFVGARGSPCGDCPDQVSVIPLYPDAGPSDAGASEPSKEWTPTAEQCDRACGSNHSSCRGVAVSTGDGGTVPGIECMRHGECGAGRRPAGLQALGVDALPEGAIDGWLTTAAHLEAASVHAFKRLRAELATHGAPRRLLRATSRAARDEQRHARTMSALVRRRGGRTPPVALGATPTRPILALAIENAIEGCVRETWAALLAQHQALHAREPLVRAAMKKIALDEARHAALAWTIDRHLRPRLDRSARALVDELRGREARKVIASAGKRLAGHEALGLPRPEEAVALATRLYRALGIPDGEVLDEPPARNERSFPFFHRAFSRCL